MWDDASIPMKATSAQVSDSFHIKDPKGINNVVGHIAGDKYKKILQAKYKKANLTKEVEDNCLQLNSSQRKQLIKLLTKFEKLFDDTLGTWKNTKYNTELKPGVTPYHGRPYSIPWAYKQQLQVEVEQLVKIGVLQKVNSSEWGAPTIVIPKKDWTIRFISDFQELNKRLKENRVLYQKYRIYS